MKKRIIFYLIFGVSVIFKSQSQTVETYSDIDFNGNIVVNANMFAQMKGDSAKIGFTTYSTIEYAIQSNEVSGEILAGFYGAKGAFTGGLMVGIETAKGVWRVSPYIYLYNPKAFLSIIYEHGASGYWYEVEFGTTLFRKDDLSLSLGMQARRFAGLGPKIDLQTGKWYVFVIPIRWQRPVDVEVSHGNLGTTMGFGFQW